MSKNQTILIILSLVFLGLSIYFFSQALPSKLPQNLNLINLKSSSPTLPNQNPSPGVSSLTQATASGLFNLQGLEQAKVSRVVDGDTIEVNFSGQIKKLRLIGINTPETVDPRKAVECFGKEASNETNRLLTGKTVYLEKDVTETDKFGRLLRFVYLKLDDGSTLFVNDYLVRQGFALADTFPPDVKNADKFRQAQVEARDNLRGLWNKCPIK